jgi:dTDP-4-amino-4,6-dideoxygalactose transaminase
MRSKVNKLKKRLGFMPVDKNRSKELIYLDKYYSFPKNRSTMTLKESIAAARSVLSGRLTLFSGDNMVKFEEEFARYQSSKHAVAVTSGTAALQIAIAAAGIGEGDEVIVPALTFLSTATAVLYNNATPVFVDVNRSDANINTTSIEKAITDRTKAIIPVHLCGVPCDMDEIMDIARRHDLKVIEDAAQAFGAKYRGKLVGSMGDMGCFSFYESKNMVTGEGGMVTTDDPDLFNRLAIYSNIGKSRVTGECERSSKLSEDVHFAHLGWNYRMTDIQAAIGNVQLKRVGKLLEQRRRNSARLAERLSSIEEIIPADIAPYKDPALNVFIIKLNEACKWVNRDWLYMALARKGVPVFLPNARPVNEHPIFFSKGSSKPDKIFENSRYLLDNVVVANVGPHLGEMDMDKIGKSIEEILAYNRRVKAVYVPQDLAQGEEHAPVSLPESGFFAGSGKEDITPDRKVFLPAHETDSKGVGDPLFVRSVIMGTKDNKVCLIQIDTLGMHYDTALELRKSISKAIGIPVENIFLLFTHTHSAPDLLGVWGGAEKWYFELLHNKVLKSVIAAHNSIKPAKIEAGTGDITDCIRNFDPEKPGDTRLSVIRITDDISGSITTIVNAGIHSPEKGEFSGDKKGHLSAELPGYICERGDDLFGGTTLFINSMLGDSYPIIQKASVPEVPIKLTGSFSEDCIAFGERMMTKIKELEMAPVKDTDNVSVSTKTFDIPCSDTLLCKEYIPRGFSRTLKAGRLTTEIAGITIGELEIAAFPGELLTDYGNDILNKMSKPYRLIFSLSNDTIGYIIPAESYKAGGVKECESLGTEAGTNFQEHFYELKK